MDHNYGSGNRLYVTSFRQTVEVLCGTAGFGRTGVARVEKTGIDHVPANSEACLEGPLRPTTRSSHHPRLAR